MLIDQHEYEKTLDVMDRIPGIRKLLDKPVRKTTVILTTHDLGDIKELCERLIIINIRRWSSSITTKQRRSMKSVI